MNRTEKIFDEVAKSGLYHSSMDEEAVFVWAVNHFDLAGKSILDVGCGTGDKFDYCQRAEYLEGFDISREAIIKAREKRGVFLQCSLEGYISGRKFDLIIAWGVFEYFEDPQKALEEIISLLTPEGGLILFVSKPTWEKRFAFVLRWLLSKIPVKSVLPVAKGCVGFLRFFFPQLEEEIWERAIIQGLMVEKYNSLDPGYFKHRLKDFSLSIYDKFYSMTCIVAR